MSEEIPIGPNRCVYCGGEYGEHDEDCREVKKPTTDTIPEAIQVANNWGYYPTPGLNQLLREEVTKACLAYHQRKLAECGDIESIRNTLATCDDPLNKAIELLQLHTAKAVEELRKQCEGLRRAITAQDAERNVFVQDFIKMQERAEKAEAVIARLAAKP